MPLFKGRLRDEESIVHQGQKDTFSCIDFGHRKSSDLGPSRVAISLVLYKFGSHYQTGKKHPPTTIDVGSFPFVVLSLLS